MMGEKFDFKKGMYDKIMDVVEEYQTSEATASMAVLSANLFMINGTLARINRNLERIMEADGEKSLLRVCGVIDTFEQN